MNKIGLSGSNGRVDKSAFYTTDSLLHTVGQNTGNLLFQYAVTNSIDEDKVNLGQDLPWIPKLARENCRIIVIPSANFIREGADFTPFVDYLEKTQLPLLFLGLGAQAANYEQKKLELHPSVLRLLSLIKERSNGVGVRGEFTAEILSQYGIDDATVIGCPTNFINKSENFVSNLKAKWERTAHSFITTGDEPWPKDLSKRDVERQMIDWTSKGHGVYLQQSCNPFVKYARQANPHQLEEVPEKDENSIRAAIAPNMTNEEFRGFIATRMRLYFSVNQWLEDAARFDFSLGMRLHGNMASWQSGTPAVWLYHDSRTRELAETMALPHISHMEFLKLNSIEEMKASANFDFDVYAHRRNELKSRYHHLLSSNGIKIA